MASFVAKAVGLEVLQLGLMAVPVFVTGHQLTSSGNSTLSANQASSFFGELSLVAYWMILLGSFLLVTLAVYLPVKLFLYRQRQSTHTSLEWRPSILLYNLLSALPCYVMILIGIQIPLSNVNAKLYEDAIYITTPIILLCLIATEWVAKWKEDDFSSDMAEAMLNDFHTAYDIMELISLGLDDDIANKTWPIFAIFAFSLLAMFKYVPRSPKYKNDEDESGNGRAQKWLLTNIFVQDLPFFTLRITLIGLYGLKAGELLYPAKSAAGLVFRSLQLYLMKRENRKVAPSANDCNDSEERGTDEMEDTMDVEDLPVETLED
ncbi:PREDICTED: uncharacterized protein LOC109480211 [Branchiostoma belcheri]|uniref:Uncharacterized protein LOC109480211 n=1 Tax=Branchiostoma belcheri TaxID=7741 RepID=A0A6P4ZV53_BRABE|nr:PREDICTED: uncharacterized protein LOC109480211 [Branchiostoma belcheri]